MPQGSVCWPVLFSTFINDLDDGAECILSKFAGYTKLRGAADRPELCCHQRDLIRLEKQADRKLRFNKSAPEGEEPCVHAGVAQLENSFTEQNPGSWYTTS